MNKLKKFLVSLVVFSMVFNFGMIKNLITPEKAKAAENYIETYLLDGSASLINTYISTTKTSASIDLEFTKTVKVNLDIVDMSDNLVKDLYSTSGVADPRPKTWDGTNNAGNSVTDGIYKIKIELKDFITDQLLQTDTSRTITVDKIAPTVMITRTPNQGYYNNDYQISVDFDDATTKEYSLDGGIWTEYVFPVTISSEGTYTFDAKGTDEAGNIGNATQVTFTIDNTAPSVFLSDDHSSQYVKGGDNVFITATFTELNGLDGTPAINIGSVVTAAPMIATANPLVWTYGWVVPLIGDGSENLTVSISDLAGNPVGIPTGRILYTIDNTAPIITITCAPDKDIYNNDYQISVDFDDVTTKEYSLDGGIWQPYININEVTISAEGSHTFDAKGTDEAGNIGNATQVTFTIDKTVPTATVVNLDSKFFTPTFEIPYIANDNFSGSGVNFVNLYYSYSQTGKDNDWADWMPYDGDYKSSPIVFDTNLAQCDGRSCGDGYYDFYAIATDNAGNPSALITDDTIEQVSTYVKARSTSTPAGFTGKVTDKKVSLSWQEVEGAEFYEIYRSSSPYVLIATLPGDRTFYVDTGVQAGKSYYYKIIAVNSSGVRSEAAYISITLPPTIIQEILSVPQAEAAEPQEQIIPQAEAQTVIPPVEEPGKVLGDEEQEEGRNWTPIIVVISIMILGVAAYMGWQWFAKKEPADNKTNRW